jgi:hypothetical protein
MMPRAQQSSRLRVLTDEAVEAELPAVDQSATAGVLDEEDRSCKLPLRRCLCFKNSRGHLINTRLSDDNVILLVTIYEVQEDRQSGRLPRWSG